MNTQLPNIPPSGAAMPDAGLATQNMPQASQLQNTKPLSDADTWVGRIYDVFAKTESNPRQRADAIARLKAQYLYENFGIEVKVKG